MKVFDLNSSLENYDDVVVFTEAATLARPTDADTPMLTTCAWLACDPRAARGEPAHVSLQRTSTVNENGVVTLLRPSVVTRPPETRYAPALVSDGPNVP